MGYRRETGKGALAPDARPYSQVIVSKDESSIFDYFISTNRPFKHKSKKTLF